MKVLVTGAAGQLGQAMQARLATEHTLTAWARDDLDLTRHQQVRDRIVKLAPQAIVNCSGYNHVDQAQQEQETALNINGFAVRSMARAAAELDAVFIHYSSDFVFSGTSSTPYTESDQPEPQSAYAQSKLVGEWMAADAPRHYVLRVESLFGGPKRRSSIDRIAGAVRTGEAAPVFVDRVVSPSYVHDVADASAHLLKTLPQYGLYHCVNAGHATWFEVGREIARLLGKSEAALKPVHVRDVALPAPRPVFAALSNAKLARAGFAMPSWQDAIARYLSATA
ncbi:MAG TPA: dTDP-4-dehydrorhamnose reductase [Vicinamibacterales bacterium]